MWEVWTKELQDSVLVLRYKVLRFQSGVDRWEQVRLQDKLPRAMNDHTFAKNGWFATLQLKTRMSYLIFVPGVVE